MCTNNKKHAKFSNYDKDHKAVRSEEVKFYLLWKYVGF